MIYTISENVCLSKYSGDVQLDIEGLLSSFPGFMKSVKAGRVLIKPNLWSPFPSGSGCITDVRIIKAVVRCMLDAGASEVIVGEGAAVGYAFTSSYTTQDVFEASGLKKTLKNLPVKLVDLNNDSMVEVESRDFQAFDKIKVSSTAMNCDYLINLPVLKTHIRTRVTLSMKNLKGVLSPDDKKKCHQVGLDEGIADLNSILKSDLVIIDAIRGMEGLWDQEHDEVQMNLLLGAKNSLTADSLGAVLMGIDPDKVRHISLAKERRLFTDDGIEKAVIPSKYIRTFSEASDALRARFPYSMIDISESCTGCYGSITAPLLQMYNAERASMLDNMAIFSGYIPSQEELKKLAQGRNRVLLIGKCSMLKEETADNIVQIKGCPPSPEEIDKVLKD